MSERRLAFELARKNVVTCSPNDTLSKVAKLMVDHWISSIVVVEKGKPVGIVTDGIIFRLIANEHNPLTVHAKDVMSKPVLTIRPNATLPEAEEEFTKSKVKRLVFVDADGKLIGIVSKKDINRFSAYSLAEHLRRHKG